MFDGTEHATNHKVMDVSKSTYSMNDITRHGRSVTSDRYRIKKR